MVSPAKDINATLAGREARYGEFSDHARISQTMKAGMRTSKNWGILPALHKEALEMIVHKIARILNGDPDYLDNWHDITGYARLVEMELTAANDVREANKARCDMLNAGM